MYKNTQGFVATTSVSEVDAAKNKTVSDKKKVVQKATQSVESGASNKKEEDSSSEDPSNKEPDDQVITIKQSQLDDAIAAAVQTLVQEKTSANDERIKSLEEELEETKQARQSLEKVFDVLGKVAPNINTQASTQSDHEPGLVADYFSAISSAPQMLWTSRSTGETFIQKDFSAARRVFQSDRNQLRADMETWARNNGFLQGSGIVTQAATTRGDVAPGFLDYLSMVLRETHTSRYVYWQFPFYQLELGKGPRDTIQVARFRYLPEADSTDDRVLTPGTEITTGSQNLEANAVSLQLQECGLGKNSAHQPVAIPEFITAYSMLNLENALRTRLGHDYEAWEDLSIRSKYFATSRVVYNQSGSVTTTPGDVDTSGTATENFAYNLYAYLASLQIPPLDDGCYCWVMHDFALAQFKASLSANNQYLNPSNTAELTNMLQAITNREMGKTMAYAGKFAGFHIFSTNAHSMGAPGTEGVQTETLGAGATTTRSSLVFGRAAVARAIGMEATLRRDKDDDFGRLSRWTWLSHEITDYLDVDPTINAEQQLRVVEVRTTDVFL